MLGRAGLPRGAPSTFFPARTHSGPPLARPESSRARAEALPECGALTAGMAVPGWLDRPLFTLGTRRYRWAEAVELGRLTGGWKPVEQEIREGLVAASQAGSVLPGGVEQAIEEFGAAFRYARGLLTADEAEAWLARRALEPGEWLEWTRREVLRRVAAPRMADWLRAVPVSSDALTRATWVHLCCGDTGRRLAEALAVRAALAERCGTLEPTPEGLLDAWCRYRAEPVSEDRIRREMDLGGLDWVRVDCRFVAFTTAHAAREARLCVVEDGQALDAVGSAARTPVRSLRRYLGRFAPELRARLLAATPGDCVGPLTFEGWHALFVLAGKTLPDAADPELRHALARSAQGRLEREQVSLTVRWHLPWPAPDA